MPAAGRRPIIIVSTYYPPVLGGAETAAEQLAEFLAARGRRVTVVTKRTLPGVPNDEVRNQVRVVRVPPSGPRGPFAKWLALPAFTRELVRRRHEDAVIVCIDYRGVGVAALLARAITGRRVVLQAATDGVLSFAAVRRGLSRVGLSAAAGTVVRCLQWIYNRADAYPCISRQIEAETLAAGVPAERVCYLPNPVDTRAFVPATAEQKAELRARLGVRVDARVAIVVGRLSREKGQMEALRAWQIARVDRGLLLLVGPDMPKDPWDIGQEAREFVRAQHLEESVRFTGGVERWAVPDYLRASDLFVQPSHFEAFGTSAIEAMAAGLPVIASDVGGLKDFVETGVNGVKVPPRDVDALAAAIARLLCDGEARARLAQGAPATAARFEITRILSEFERMIDQL